MSQATLPRILIVDDEDATQHKLGLESLAATRARHPNEVEVADLEWANLVLMDFFLEHWPERDELATPALCPKNGLALASVLREHADEIRGNGHQYTAFAIHSAHIGDVSSRLHTTNKTANVVAKLNNLEWAFDKAENLRFDRAAELARAVQLISDLWPRIEHSGVKTVAAQLLSPPAEVVWAQRAFDDIVLCQIPLSEFSAGSNGLLFLRWLLHSVLPYPTFLWAKHWVAARLRISPESLDFVLAGDSQLKSNLLNCQYTGVLSSFQGDRWWRAGIEQFAWSIRASGAREPKDFHSALETLAGDSLTFVDFVSPVVCVDRQLNPQDKLQPLESVVRLVPDLWPAYADAAYAEINVVREDADLGAIVHPLDRDRVSSEDGEE